MDSITQIVDLIEKFSKINFKFTKYIEMFRLMKHVPESISSGLNSAEFIHHISEAYKHISWLIDYFDDNVMKTVKKELHKVMNSKEKMQEYADFSVPKDPPLFRKPRDMSGRVEQLSFETINSEHAEKTGKEIAPVSRRKKIEFKGNCPFCQAPNEYLYDNSGKGTQYRCKACRQTFTAGCSPKEEIGLYCPHCGRKMFPHHDRMNYIVYRCDSYDCPYYTKNRKMLDDGEGKTLETSSGGHLLHYTYREFRFSMDDIRKYEENHTDPESGQYKAKLSRIKADQQALGLILCFYVNYGLSSRKTARIMKDLYGLKISHQTVINYGAIISKMIAPMIDHYPYKLSSTGCGDETYIKIRGKNHYVFFWSDTESRIITSYRIYPVRDTESAVKSIYDLLIHYGNSIPDDLTLVTDGNPIYNAAQLFYSINGISFDLHQVIGVRNRDSESKEWRPHKQKEERLNRTYKENYYGTNGYDTLEGANQYMILYVAYYNFFREHSALNYRTPVDDGLFDDCLLMQDRWLKLISLSAGYGIQF